MFIYRATELDRIDSTFRRVKDERDEIDGKRERLTDSLQSQAAKVKALKEKVDQFKAVEHLEKKRLALEVGYACAFFRERDQDHQQMLDVSVLHRFDSRKLITACYCMTVSCFP